MKKKIFIFLHWLCVRPLLILFVLITVYSLFISMFILRKDYYKEDEYVCINGRVQNIELDESGNIKSFSVGNLLCYVNSNISLSLHDRVTIKGKARLFEEPRNLGEFNSRKYNYSRKLYSYVNSPEVTVTKPSSCLIARFHRLKNRLSNKVNKNCQFEAGTINTLILADKRFLSDSKKALYQLAGVAHFLVISGLHISAFGAFFYKLSVKIFKKRTIACLISMLILILYGLLIGFSVSIIRAIIMYCVRLFSYIIKETYDMLSAISLAGSITLLFNPVLVINSAFIYSYSTVIFISLYLEFINTTTRKTDSIHKKIMNLISFPALLSLYLAPVSLYLSFAYSPASILLNIILMPLSGPILLLASLAFLFSVFNIQIIARLFDVMLTLILKVLDTLCKLVTIIPGSSILHKPPIVAIIIYYIMLTCALYLVLNKTLPRFWFELVAPVLVMLFLAPSLYVPKVAMLYVGQGEGLIIHTSHNSAIIMDCGSSTKKNIAQYTVIPYLKASGVTSVDAIFASHSDIDHINGISDLLEQGPKNGIKIDSLIIPDTPLFYDAEGRQLITASINNKVNVYAYRQGYNLYSHGWHLTCLWPSSDTLSDSNSSSMVTLASLHNFSMLVTGDITLETEDSLIKTYKKSYLAQTDVLKVAHHGSKTATGDAFLSVLNPRLAIISAGINNSYHHPNDEVLYRLNQHHIECHVTSKEGEIDVFPFLPTDTVITLHKFHP